MTIKAGTTVVWLNNGENAHTLVYDSGLTSGRILPGGNAAHTFSTPGTYNYHDEMSAFLVGTITVQ